MKLLLRSRSGASVIGDYRQDCHSLSIDGTELSPEPADDASCRASRMLRLSLGKRCNFSCAYCHQSPWKKDTPPDGDDSALAAIAAFCAKEQRAGRPFASIQLWGGEPFLYFPLLRAFLQELHKAGVTGFSYDLTTNGSLLFGERLDWVLRHPEVHVNISWDGPGQFLRGKDVLRESPTAEGCRRLFRQKPDTALAPVISRAVTSTEDILQQARKLLHRQHVAMLDPALLVACDPSSRRQGKTLEELRRFAWDTSSLLLQHKLPQTMHAYRNARDIARLFGSPLLRSPQDTMCFAGSRYTLTIDLAGNILTCQNFNADSIDISGDRHCRGNIFTGTCTPPEFTRLHQRLPHCADCLLLQLCKGGCPYTIPEYADYNCSVHFYQLLPLFVLAIFYRTGLILQGWQK